MHIFLSSFIQHLKKIILQPPGPLKAQNRAQIRDPSLHQVRTYSTMYLMKLQNAFLRLALLLTDI